MKWFVRGLIVAAGAAIAAAVAMTAVSSGSVQSKALTTASHCSSKPVTVGYVPKLGTDPYMITVRNAAQAAAKRIGGRVIYTSPSDATGPAQIPFVNQLIAQHVGVIAISGNDLNSSAAALKKATKMGISVISWDSDVATSARTLFINQAKTPLLGKLMLDSMYKMLNGQGDFAILSSTPTAVNQNAWIAAMRNRLATDPKLAKLHLVTVAYGQEKADVNAQQALSLVETYPNLKGIIVPAGIGLPAAAQALANAGKLGKVKLTGLAPATLIKKYIVGGNVQDIWWNVTNLGTLSYYAAQSLAQCKITGKPGQTFKAGSLGTFRVGANGVVILGPPIIVTPRNVNSFSF